MKEKFKKIWEIAVPYLKKGRVEKEHIHTRYVVRFMERLIKEENLKDEDILIPAAILHDIGFSQLSKEVQDNFTTKEGRIAHMEEGAKLARKILTEVNYNKSKISEICKIVSEHDNPKIDRKITTKNGWILWDADVLWQPTKKAFWFDVKALKQTPQERLQRIKWRITSLRTKTAHKIAKELVKAREKEVNSL